MIRLPAEFWASAQELVGDGGQIGWCISKAIVEEDPPALQKRERYN
jgi:hypothetical protein